MMNIPTKHTTTKRKTLMIGGLAAVVGLAGAPAAMTYAHDGHNSNSSKHDKRGNGGDQHRNYDKSRIGSLGWINHVSADDFTKRNDKQLAQLDKYIQKNQLTIENGDELRAEVDAQASVVADELTKLQDLRATVGDIRDVSPDQRTALKTQLQALIGSYYDYKFALYDHVEAIKAAAKANKLDTNKQELNVTIQ